MEIAGDLAFDQGLSDLTGFAQDGREFAVVGLIDSVAAAFVDITDPENPFEVGRISGTPNIWRDLKYWNRHVYIGTEANDGIKVVSVDDPDNPVLVNTITNITHSHNIHIDADGYLYVIGSTEYAILIYDLSIPELPELVGTWNDEYLHDIEVFNNKIYGAAIYSGNFYIIDVSDKTNSTTILKHNTGVVSGTHDCAVTYDEQYLITADETVGGHLKIWDIRDYENINLISQYSIHSEHSLHNIYIRPGTNLVVMSYYIDGTRILNISDPANPVEVGYYDTSWLSPLFNGNWGTYAYLPSGYIISSDRQNGLFIFSSPLTDPSLSWSDCDPEKNNWYGDYIETEIAILEELIELNPALDGFLYNEFIEFDHGKIITIDLKDLGLDSLIFPDDIGNLTNLESLNIGGNNLTNLPSTICDLPEDCTIDVSRNYLCLNELQLYAECIPIKGYQHCGECESAFLTDGYCNNAADVDVLWNLIAINDTLTGANPMELGKAFAGTSNWNVGNLEYLDLSFHGILVLPENMGDLDFLKELNLKNNLIEMLPESFSQMDSLLILKLHNNMLSSLPEDIGNLENLKKLFLPGNQLTSIPDSIGELQNLKILNLQQNLLTSLPSTICDLPEDCTIKIDDNCIAGNYDCIPDPGDQNECSSMNLINSQPADYQLFAPYPNPFNPLTTISFYLHDPGFTSIQILNLNGRVIATLSNEFTSSGYHTINWDASDFSSGVYFIRMISENNPSLYINSQKIVLLK